MRQLRYDELRPEEARRFGAHVGVKLAFAVDAAL
jgi:hypothetical protein